MLRRQPEAAWKSGWTPASHLRVVVGRQLAEWGSPQNTSRVEVVPYPST